MRQASKIQVKVIYVKFLKKTDITEVKVINQMKVCFIDSQTVKAHHLIARDNPKWYLQNTTKMWTWLITAKMQNCAYKTKQLCHGPINMASECLWIVPSAQIEFQSPWLHAVFGFLLLEVEFFEHAQKLQRKMDGVYGKWNEATCSCLLMSKQIFNTVFTRI